ncbi:unnamed protein product [Brachionus calyciflorus]|uniref:Uncharacterized protein n=1 Tax=Brachionus calyciflorus TaxID=104777 RepID=A0A814M5H6_9BILA|nr:unnamed protein product [Brachionus calyciflorus]
MFLAESEEEIYNKSRVYKQAQDIKNVTLLNPKFKRISDGVTKVFGLNDPPPGFGLSYPKYYYLEQKRPQPMSPLKVWRGFNGNIYFEPIIYNAINGKDQSNKNHQADDVENISKLEVKKDDTEESNDDLKLNNSSIEKEHSSDNFKNLNLFPNIKDFDAMSSSTLNGTKNFIKFSTNSTNFTKPKHNNSPNLFVTKEMTFSGDLNLFKRNRSFSNTKSILPNLSAVKRNNSPLKGLAYREVKNRFSSDEFLLKNNTTIQSQDVLPFHNEIEIDKKNSLFESNFIHNSDNFSTRPSYKEMLKGIRRGVTLTNFTKTKDSDDFDANKNESSKLIGKTDKNKKLMVRKPFKDLKYDKYLKVELIPLRDPFKTSSSNKTNNNLFNFHSNSISVYSLSLSGSNATPEVNI